MNCLFKNQIVLLTDSPDSYLDIFDVFYQMFRKYWADCPFPFYLTVENSNNHYDGINVIKCGKGMNQIQRLVHALKSINAEYIILFDEDIIFSKHINNRDIERIPKVMEDFNLVYYRLAPFPKQRKISLNGYNYLSYIDTKKKYGKSLMFQIIKKDYLMNLFQEGKCTGWDIENNWVKESLLSKEKKFIDFVIDSRDLFGMIHGVSKGKWIRSSVKRLKRSGCIVDLSKRPQQSIKESIKNNIGSLVVRFFSNRFIHKIKKILIKIGFVFSIDN